MLWTAAVVGIFYQTFDSNISLGSPSFVIHQFKDFLSIYPGQMLIVQCFEDLPRTLRLQVHKRKQYHVIAIQHKQTANAITTLSK